MLVRFDHSLACVKIWGATPLEIKIWSSKKDDLGGYDFTSAFPLLLNQSSPNFFA